MPSLYNRVNDKANSIKEVNQHFSVVQMKMDYDTDEREKEILGEKWEDLKNREVKNTSKEIKLLKKKIRYLKDRVSMYEDELATLEGGYVMKDRFGKEEEGLDRLAEMKRTVGDDHTRKI